MNYGNREGWICFHCHKEVQVLLVFWTVLYLGGEHQEGFEYVPPVKCVGSSDRCAHGRHAPPGRVTEPCPVGHSSSSEGQLPLFLYLWKNIKTCTCSKEAPSTVHSTWNLPSNSKEGSGSKEAHLSTQTWLPNLQQTSEWRLCMVSRMPRVMADTLPFCCHVQPHGNSFSLARGR